MCILAGRNPLNARVITKERFSSQHLFPHYPIKLMASNFIHGTDNLVGSTLFMELIMVLELNIIFSSHSFGCQRCFLQYLDHQNVFAYPILFCISEEKLILSQVCDFGLSRLKHHTFLSSKSTSGTVRFLLHNF